jgi:hypothetical protein
MKKGKSRMKTRADSEWSGPHRPAVSTIYACATAKQRGATVLKHGFLIGLACFMTVAALGQYSIGWYTFGGGGGNTSNALYAVNGTIGQHDAGGQLSGGGYSLVGGFWAIYAVQKPGAPRLTIRVTPTNTVVVAWPSPSTGFELQQNSGLNPTSWVTALEPVTDNGVSRFIIINPSGGDRFYRLKNP